MARKKKFRDLNTIQRYISEVGKEHYRHGTERAADDWAKKTNTWLNYYVPNIRAKYMEAINKYGGPEKYLEATLDTKFDVAREIAKSTQKLAREHLAKALSGAQGLATSGISVESYKDGRAKARQTVEDVEEITF